MPARLIQQQFRLAFATWGRPEECRFDNGWPWGGWNDWPPELALWLIGLGIGVLWNPPRRPQHNGVIERSQGTAVRWAEPGQCHSAAELQRRLDEEDRVQREEYPSIGGLSRREAYPGLAHAGRAYSERWEQRHWDWGRVCAYLAEYLVERRVDSNGKVWLYNHPHSVGVLHRGERVFVQFDPEQVAWMISGERGELIRQLPADQLSPERVRSLNVSVHRARGK